MQGSEKNDQGLNPGHPAVGFEPSSSACSGAGKVLGYLGLGLQILTVFMESMRVVVQIMHTGFVCIRENLDALEKG